MIDSWRTKISVRANDMLVSLKSTQRAEEPPSRPDSRQRADTLRTFIPRCQLWFLLKPQPMARHILLIHGGVNFRCQSPYKGSLYAEPKHIYYMASKVPDFRECARELPVRSRRRMLQRRLTTKRGGSPPDWDENWDHQWLTSFPTNALLLLDLAPTPKKDAYTFATTGYFCFRHTAQT